MKSCVKIMKRERRNTNQDNIMENNLFQPLQCEDVVFLCQLAVCVIEQE